MDPKKEKIIQQAAEIFMRFGIKSVNMEDMARHLGISKKTLYLYVRDKDELVEEVVSHFSHREANEIQQICSRKLNSIDESLEIMKWVLSILQDIHPSVEYDMEKYHPSVYQKMKQHRNKVVFECMTRNMKLGQKDGLYRKDFRPEIIAKIYMSRLNVMLDQELFPQSDWSLSEIYTETYIYHIRGIASDKGLAYLREKMKLKN